jgi:hypothetical protein
MRLWQLSVSIPDRVMATLIALLVPQRQIRNTKWAMLTYVYCTQPSVMLACLTILLQAKCIGYQLMGLLSVAVIMENVLQLSTLAFYFDVFHSSSFDDAGIEFKRDTLHLSRTRDNLQLEV